ncbi:MAG: Rrf2 family transcriptional regulator [Candidatus Cloacimonadota bacterium]|nr:MAG: Rrf2 family transcriptional regulator [Deltaproteobacteria bacterium]RLC54919.1 MAG: Rrf2 family transcriptional regulator [Candidatus Cloacimonadota bacterium]
MAHVIQFSEAAFIALHGMVLVAKAKDEELVNVIQISDRLNSSKHHVAKVMQRMVKSGYLNSHRGPSGGFSMKIPAGDIRLLDLYESIEGKIEIGDCPLDHPVCKFDKCIFNGVTKKMTEQFVAYMKGERLSDFI